MRPGWRMAAVTLLMLQGLAWLAPGVAGAAQTEIMDFGYSPDDFAVAAGEEVAWLNTGGQVHTVVADAGSAESFESAPIEPGGRFTHTFRSPGTISYHCELHRSMRGAVRVVAPPPTPPRQAPPRSSKAPGPAVSPPAPATPPRSASGRGVAATQPAPTAPPPNIAVVAPPPQPSLSAGPRPTEPAPYDGLPPEPGGASPTVTTTGPGAASEGAAGAEMPSRKRSSQPWRPAGGWADLPMAALGAALIAGGAGWLVKIRLDHRR